jgi:hypothetical protein
MIVCQIKEVRVVVNADKAIKLGSKASAVYCLVQRGIPSWPGAVEGLHSWWCLILSQGYALTERQAAINMPPKSAFTTFCIEGASVHHKRSEFDAIKDILLKVESVRQALKRAVLTK